jgi:hypothetical protein
MLSGGLVPVAEIFANLSALASTARHWLASLACRCGKADCTHGVLGARRLLTQHVRHPLHLPGSRGWPAIRGPSEPATTRVSDDPNGSGP